MAQESTEVAVFRWFFIVLLVVLSALFCGLTLGLMTLDLTELEIIISSGSPKDSANARKIYPIREKGHLLLCTLLVGTVLVNNTFSILMADMTSGVVGALISIFVTVVLGEIIPQAVCSRHGLSIGAKTIYIVYFFLVILFPVTYPISKLLDWILPHDSGTIYDRNQLKKLLDIHSGHMAESNLSRRDVNMLSGVLDYKSKCVEDIMTPIHDVFMLDLASCLDFQTITTILQRGHSRIPIYEDVRDNIVGVLLVKDLALINPEEAVPVRTVLGFYNRQLPKAYTDVRLDDMLQQFKRGRSHLAVVSRVSYGGSDHPEYETVGIVTLEDVIEELIQEEIVDETDVGQGEHSASDYKQLGLFRKGSSVHAKLTPQQTTAIYNFLSREIPEFSPAVLSEESFRQMLAQCSVDVIKRPSKGETFVYKRGVPDKNFTLVLQGKLEIRSGSENFLSQTGTFSSLGIAALQRDDFVPDFSARVIESVELLRIQRSQYLEAVSNSRT